MHITVLCGGVGGSRFLRAVCEAVDPRDVTAIVNTGDDFSWNGLSICPDLDTVTYLLAGLSNEVTGWGVADDSFRCLRQLEKLGGKSWFSIGDMDLAMHLRRTALLHQGKTLTETTKEITQALGLEVSILPMCDTPAPTLVETEAGLLSFQEYFVRDHCEHTVQSITQGGENPVPTEQALAAVEETDLLLIAPSNPFVSIGTILSLPGMREAVQSLRCPKIGVSPIMGGAAVKGPAAKLLRDFGYPVSAAGVAGYYQGILDHLFIAREDAPVEKEISQYGITPHSWDIMLTAETQRKLLMEQIFSI